MSLFLKEELTVAGHNLVVKERIAEGGFGFVDLVTNPQTGQEFVVSKSIKFLYYTHFSHVVKTMWNSKTRNL